MKTPSVDKEIDYLYDQMAILGRAIVQYSGTKYYRTLVGEFTKLERQRNVLIEWRDMVSKE